jgi:hypothetical protein
MAGLPRATTSIALMPLDVQKRRLLEYDHKQKKIQQWLEKHGRDNDQFEQEFYDLWDPYRDSSMGIIHSLFCFLFIRYFILCFELLQNE